MLKKQKMKNGEENLTKKCFKIKLEDLKQKIIESNLVIDVKLCWSKF